MTRIEIDLFLPRSNAYVVYVNTDNRGVAIKTVMAELKLDALPYINEIHARQCCFHEPGYQVLEPVDGP